MTDTETKNEYELFLAGKGYKLEPSGFDTEDIHPKLYPFQRDIVKWALRYHGGPRTDGLLRR